jgi:hypothetical protein
LPFDHAPDVTTRTWRVRTHHAQTCRHHPSPPREVDNQAHEIRFYVNGDQITTLNSFGLHSKTAQ